jgi:hypothetical protein
MKGEEVGLTNERDLEQLDVKFKHPPEIPEEWVELINQMHPITAVVIWEILTGNLSPASLRLARYSPDRERYTSIAIIAGGNPDYCGELAEMARQDLDEIFADLLPEFRQYQVLH